jgi:hypothetical protein
MFQARENEWYLTTAEKKRILLNNIFGVDIDSQAVEVTKMSLLLKVLEHESRESIDQRAKLGLEGVLPNLEDNIKCGNSLIGSEYYELGQQGTLFNEEEMRRVNVFDWDDERKGFGGIMKRGGFDCVIGNPPYVRIQTLQETQPEAVHYFKNRYNSGAKGNFVFDFGIEKIFDDFLSGKYGKKDKDIIKRKTYYFDIFAITLFISKEYLKIKEKIERANKEFIEYYLLTDEILRMAFMRVGKPVEAIEDYKFFKNILRFDIVNNARSATEQGYWYANDLLGMLAEREVVEGSIGIKYLLDMYIRFCESSFEFINLFRIAIEVADGVENPESHLPYLENLEIIKLKQKYSKLVESIDPHIRHSESHMNTRIDDEKGEIVLINTSRGKEEVVGEYTFHELSDMTKTILYYNKGIFSI